jgi:hypothetical protein
VLSHPSRWEVFNVSYVKLDIADLRDAREQVRESFLQQDESISKIRDVVAIHAARPRKTRRVFAVDSGFNTAYETTFTILKAAVVDEALEVDRREDIYLFHVDNYQTDRLRRLLMQQILYEALAKTIRSGKADGSLVLVDGTIALTVFYPTLKDRREYRRHFQTLYEELYAPLMDRCVERNILVLGFLKRTGSTYLAEYLNVRGAYDIYLVNAFLREEGQYIGPIPVIDAGAKRAKIHHQYVTFYLNLKNWVYRFELLKEQEQTHREGIENLLYLATEAHYGMNPIFSKADEYARVTKRETNLKFDYVIHELDAEDRTRLRLEARKRTHFGYATKRLSGRLTAG